MSRAAAINYGDEARQEWQAHLTFIDFYHYYHNSAAPVIPFSLFNILAKQYCQKLKGLIDPAFKKFKVADLNSKKTASELLHIFNQQKLAALAWLDSKERKSATHSQSLGLTPDLKIHQINLMQEKLLADQAILSKAIGIYRKIIRNDKIISWFAYLVTIINMLPFCYGSLFLVPIISIPVTLFLPAMLSFIFYEAIHYLLDKLLDFICLGPSTLGLQADKLLFNDFGLNLPAVFFLEPDPRKNIPLLDSHHTQQLKLLRSLLLAKTPSAALRQKIEISHVLEQCIEQIKGLCLFLNPEEFQLWNKRFTQQSITKKTFELYRSSARKTEIGIFLFKFSENIIRILSILLAIFFLLPFISRFLKRNNLLELLPFEYVIPFIKQCLAFIQVNSSLTLMNYILTGSARFMLPILHSYFRKIFAYQLKICEEFLANNLEKDFSDLEYKAWHSFSVPIEAKDEQRSLTKFKPKYIQVKEFSELTARELEAKNGAQDFTRLFTMDNCCICLSEDDKSNELNTKSAAASSATAQLNLPEELFIGLTTRANPLQGPYHLQCAEKWALTKTPNPTDPNNRAPYALDEEKHPIFFRATQAKAVIRTFKANLTPPSTVAADEKKEKITLHQQKADSSSATANPVLSPAAILLPVAHLQSFPIYPRRTACDIVRSKAASLLTSVAALFPLQAKRAPSSPAASTQASVQAPQASASRNQALG